MIPVNLVDKLTHTFIYYIKTEGFFIMGKTKSQQFIFTLMMCFGMVLGMTIYNMLLNEGFHDQFFNHLLKDFWLGFVVALLLDVFIVGKLAKPIAFKIVKPDATTQY